MNNQIVIVEDEFIVAEDLRIIVEKYGNVVAGIAASVEEASVLIQRHTPGLVLLDINLEGNLTGIELAWQLKEAAIPFIFISAYSNRSILEAANATQPYGFLVKPFRERDVVVALDIARYRFQNSLESALQREQLLVRSLLEISAGIANPENKLLKIAVALQAHIPFDYFFVCKISNGDLPYSWLSFLRMGMLEYQTVGLKELLTITGIQAEDLKKMQLVSIADKEGIWHNGDDFKDICRINLFKNLLAHTFELESNLAIPISNLNNGTCIFSFYSRKSDAYNEWHLALLNRLGHVLAPASDYLSLLFKQDKPSGYSPIYNFEGIIGNDPSLLSVLDQLALVAPLDTSVLIQGETGTGKEQIASCIHQMSGRASKPMVKINCAVLPPTLFESELFGHEKGAFTGATDKKAGKFEQAEGGTIFLDEIGEIPLEMQAKLLRVLQEREIERIGSKVPIKVDVRIVAATNRILEKEVAEGRFRIDLFYRLNAFPLTIPPLRERKSDISQLATYFAQRFSKKFNKSFHGITMQMMLSLEDYNWPGNIRELENVIEQSVILNDGKSALELKRTFNSSQPAALKNSTLSDPENLEQLRKLQTDKEREYIVNALKKSKGRIRGQNGAAQFLNIPPTTLESRIAKHRIKKDEYL